MKNSLWLVVIILLIQTKQADTASQATLDASLECSSITSESVCDAKNYCLWSSAYMICAQKLLCDSASTQAECLQMTTCDWAFGSCYDKCFWSIPCSNNPSCDRQKVGSKNWCLSIYIATEPNGCIGGTWNSATDSCDCTGQWNGDQCEECPAGYDGGQSGTCAVCIANSTSGCAPCDRSSCSAHVSGITTGNITHPGCHCECLPNYDGPRCDQCSPGYFGYPTCVHCDPLHCNGLSLTTPVVVGNTCACDCPSQYGGLQCNECAPGYFDYPTCTKCDDAYCSNNSASMPVVFKDKCDCDCQTKYVGDQCTACSTGFNYPICADCDQAFCSNQSKTSPTVHPVTRVCQCDCEDGIGGPQCERCLANRIDYPNCTLCTVVDHCNSNAAIAVANGTSECACLCNEGFDGSDCSYCAPGYKNYPRCDPDCTAAVYCHGNGAAKSMPPGPCSCDCLPSYDGSRCELCKPDLVYWPTCRSCDTTLDCAGHGSSVVPLPTGDGCTCTCEHQWDPSTNCSTCPLPYAGSLCNRCADGYFGNPPQCVECDVGIHCNGRSISVTVNSSNNGCTCKCILGWTGAECEICPDLYNQTTCASCALEHASAFPDCIPLDTPAPAPISTAVPSSPAPMGCSQVCESNQTQSQNNITCECNCRPQYSGLLCEIDCLNECENGGIRWANATDPCQCECSEGWAGNSCEVPPKSTKLNPINLFENNEVLDGVATVNLGTTSTSRLRALSALCGVEDDILDPEIAPLKFKIGSTEHAMYIGGIVGDIIVMTSPILIHLAAVLIRMRTTKNPQNRSFKNASADLRFPYLSLFFIIFMYHGMATCGLKLSIFGTVAERFIGIVSLLSFNIGFLALIGVQSKRLAGEVKFHEKEKVTALSKYFLGPGEWVSTSTSRKVHRWGLLFEMYRPGFTWFLIFECLILLIITVVQVIEADRMPVCRNLAVLLSSLFSLFAVVIFMFGPWASKFDNHGNFLIISMEAVACGFLARGFNTGDRNDWGFTYSENLLLVVSYMTVAKGFIDPLLLLYVEWSRRNTVQRDYNIARDEHTPHELATFETPFDDEVCMEDSFMYYAQHDGQEPSDWKSVESHTSVPNLPASVGEGLTLLTARKYSSDRFSLRSPLSATKSSLHNLTSNEQNQVNTTTSGTYKLCSYPLLERLKEEVEISL